MQVSSSANSRPSRRVLVVLVVAGSARLCDARAAPSQAAALWQLYEIADGPRWEQKQNWNPTGDPCSFDYRWVGVGCTDPCHWSDGTDCLLGKVTALTLDYNRLNGNLTDWDKLGALTNLTVIDLSGNSLRGALPTELGEVQTLLRFDAPLNQLGGFLPTELGAINMQFAVTDLLQFNLRDNSISGTVPSQLGVHTRIELIELRENSLSGTIPLQLVANHTKLLALHAHDNPRLSGTLPTELGDATSLRFVNFARCALSGTLPPSLGGMPELYALDMESNNLTGTIPDELTDLRVLRTLRLANNHLEGNLPERIGNMARLEVLDVYNNSMDGDVPASIRDLTELKELYLAHEHLLPIRRKYCGQRFPDIGKYSWVIIRAEYDQMMNAYCPDDQLLSTRWTWGKLQDLLPHDEL